MFRSSPTNFRSKQYLNDNEDDEHENSSEEYQSPDHSKALHIDFEPKSVPIVVRFKTRSTQIDTINNHQKSPGKTQHFLTVEKPDRLIHTVKKPVIQYIHEMIIPYRKHVQVVEPVKELILTKIGTSANKPDITSVDEAYNQMAHSKLVPQYHEMAKKKTTLADDAQNVLRAQYVSLKKWIKPKLNKSIKRIGYDRTTTKPKNSSLNALDQQLFDLITHVIENDDFKQRLKLFNRNNFGLKNNSD